MTHPPAVLSLFMSSGLPMQSSMRPASAASSEQKQLQPTRLKLLPVPPPSRNRVLTTDPRSPAMHALILEHTWVCQECNQAPASVQGCYCQECVRDFRSCMGCGAAETAQHKANRHKHKSSTTRLQYVCLPCAQQQMLYAQQQAMSPVGSYIPAAGSPYAAASGSPLSSTF